MGKTYKIVAIDDQPDIFKITLGTLKRYVKYKHNYDIEYTIYSGQEDFDRISDQPADIVMFDMALTASNFTIIGTGESTKLGYELIKKFRETNKRTKIVFYSGSFNLSDPGSFPFTTLDFVGIINELNVFAFIPRNDIDLMGETVVRAIESIDSVLVSLEDLILKYGEDGIFTIDDTDYTAEELLKELRMGSLVGEKFRKQITETIVTYFMKFGD